MVNPSGESLYFEVMTEMLRQANSRPDAPTLPPSVEEAYRRKCIQLRRRMKTVEEANDASRIRLLRMRRGIEKMRLERAFLLEQLTKRTSTNVEDSDGSPSPPPTVCTNLLYIRTRLTSTAEGEASEDQTRQTSTRLPPRPGRTCRACKWVATGLSRWLQRLIAYNMSFFAG